MFLVLFVVRGIPANLLDVAFVKNLTICPEPAPSRACAGVVSSPVTWPVSVGRLGASLVLRPLFLFLFLFLIQFLFQLIQFLMTLFLIQFLTFLSLILFLTTLILFLLRG